MYSAFRSKVLVAKFLPCYRKSSNLHMGRFRSARH